MVTSEAEKDALFAGSAESSAFPKGGGTSPVNQQARAFLEGPVGGGDVDGIGRFDAVTHLESGEGNYAKMIKSCLESTKIPAVYDATAPSSAASPGRNCGYQ